MKYPSGSGPANVLSARVLDTVYGNRVQTLYSLLVQILVEFFRRIDGHAGEVLCGNGLQIGSKGTNYVELEKEKVEKLLVREDDTQVYSDMLSKSFAVMAETAPRLNAVSLEQRWTQQQIVERVIELQFRQELNPSHVLCSGYRKLRPSPVQSSWKRAPVGLECPIGNAAVDLVNSENWKILLSRVGDSVMLHLLTYAAIFVPLPNSCLLQISGVSISLTVRGHRKSAVVQAGKRMLRSGDKRKHRSWMSPKRPGKESRSQQSDEGTAAAIDQEGTEVANYCAHDSVTGNGNVSFSTQRSRSGDVENSSVEMKPVKGRIHGEKRKYQQGPPICSHICLDNKLVSPNKMKRRNRDREAEKDVLYTEIQEPASGCEEIVLDGRSGHGLSHWQDNCRSWKDIAQKKNCTKERGDCFVSTPPPVTIAANACSTLDVEEEQDKRGDSKPEKKTLRKRVRQPSWIRRRMRRDDEAQQRVSQCQEGVVSSKDGCERGEVAMTTQEERSTTMRVTMSRNMGQEKDYVRTIAASPSAMFINRGSIFYSANFCRYPGLPGNHILNRTKSDDAGVNKLYASIFGSNEKASANSSSSADSSVSTQPTKDLRRLLKQLLTRAKHCAYGKLLNRHCPLPQKLNSQLAESLTPFSNGVVAASSVSQNESRDHETEVKHVEYLNDEHSPEVEEVMNLLLGPLYCSNDGPTSKVITMTASSKLPYTKAIASNGDSDSITRDKNIRKLPKDAIDPAENALTSDKAFRTGLIASYSDHKSVVSFLWAACRAIVPPEMLGSKKCWRTLCSNIARFVSLRRHEQYNVQQILYKLKQSSYDSWLTTPGTEAHSRCSRQRLLVLWLYWFFTNLIVPLIRCHFYVTEIENYRQDVFYYRKPVWAKLRSIALDDLTNRNFKKLTKRSVAEALDSKCLGFSQVRLLPKRTGVRPIANLAAPSVGTLKRRVKPERWPTMRQLFGDVGTTLRGDSSSVRGNDRNRSSPQKTGQLSESSRCSKDKDRETGGEGEACKTITAFPQRKANLGTLAAKNPSTAVSHEVGYSGTTPSKELFTTTRGIQRRIYGKNSRPINYSFRPVNTLLRDVHSCLKLEKESYPEELGSSVFGYNDIYCKVLPFILQIKGSGPLPRLYMVVCDVTKAYDTIQQGKLLDIVREFMRSSDYDVVKYASVTPSLAAVRASTARVPSRAVPYSNYTHVLDNLAARHSHCVFTDKGLCSSIRREKILLLLEEHLQRNIVQMGRQFYQQTVGIPQGSTLSAILCSLFYGHFEFYSLVPSMQSYVAGRLLPPSREADCSLPKICKHVHPIKTATSTQSTEMDVERMLENSFEFGSQDFEGAADQEEEQAVCSDECKGAVSDVVSNVLKSSTLLRLIDDSLFISTSELAATSFVETMHLGSREYGCHANKRKTAANFPVQLGKTVVPKRTYSTDDGACFIRWSGLLVNCYTLEFQADYTRYSGQHIRSTLTVKRERHQGWHLVLKTCHYMRPKCHALFFDPRINSPATVRLNAFQAFLLCSMKFHAYISCLPPVTGGINQNFLFRSYLLHHKVYVRPSEA